MKVSLWAVAVIAISAPLAQATVLNLEPALALFADAPQPPDLAPPTPLPEIAPLLAGGLGVLGFATLGRKRRGRE